MAEFNAKRSKQFDEISEQIEKIKYDKLVILTKGAERSEAAHGILREVL
jgi:hypothetical protein